MIWGLLRDKIVVFNPALEAISLQVSPERTTYVVEQSSAAFSARHSVCPGIRLLHDESTFAFTTASWYL